MASNITPYTRDGVKIGILGGGQLARMMGESAHKLGLTLEILDPKGSRSPAGQTGFHCVVGSYTDFKGVQAIAERCKTLTMDLEHVNVEALVDLESKGWSIQPSATTLKIIQDKYGQKEFYQRIGVDTAESVPIDTIGDLKSAAKRFGLPFMLKCRRGAFDGRGNIPIPDQEALERDGEAAVKKMGANALYAEKWVPYVKELAVMVARGSQDQIDAYPVVETVQKDSICHLVLAPAQVSATVAARARSMAMQCVSKLSGRGVFGVELFVTADEKVLLNEIAPRPHNSGHYTQDACVTDQFEQHLRAVAGLSLGSCAMHSSFALMINVLGDASGTEEKTYEPLAKALEVPGSGVHYYSKDGIRKGRKLAHATVVGNTLSEVFAKAETVYPGASRAFKRDREVLGDAKQTQTRKPVVGVVMGSDSDLPTMEAAARILEEFDVPYELSVVSAHRTPRRLFSYATTALDRGIAVIIAGAGGAAHLPGMIAALTPLPVIGVPVKTSTLSGKDSLLSIVQMPRGVPVATVAIGNSTNAGLLAVRTLGLREPALLVKMQQFMRKQEQKVNDTVDKMEQMGWAPYLEQYKAKKAAAAAKK